MSEANKALVRRFYEEVLEKGNLTLVDELFASNYVYHEPTVGEVKGPEGIKQLAAMYRTAFPDLRMRIEDLVAEGDKVVSRWTGRGTHLGELMGVAPTGKQMTVTGMVISRIIGGKFVEDWENYDTLGMMQQLGALPAAAKTAA